MLNKLRIAKEFADMLNSDKIESIILFGSVARGDGKLNSDINILIVSDCLEYDDSKVIDLIIKFLFEKEQLISTSIISEDVFMKMQYSNFLSKVIDEGVVLVNN